MSAEFLSGIMAFSLSLRLHVPEEDFPELPKKLSTLGAELRLREVPGKSVEGPRWRGRLRLVDGFQREHPPGAVVVGVSRTPLRLLLPLARGLALGLRARALALAHAGVWSKPLSANATRTRTTDHRP